MIKISNKIALENYIKAFELIKQSRYILIVTHINPDADTIGSALALSNLFYENKIKHKVYNISSKLPRKLDFISRFEKITDILPPFYDLLIAIDCGSYKRLGFEVSKDIPIINFDHHISNENFGTINIVDSSKASTSELVFDFFKNNSLKITKDIATALYVGIYDDTKAFSLDRCNKETFYKAYTLVDLGAEPAYIANKLLRRESLAKYRMIPKILNSLELYKEGELAFIYALPLWFKETGASNTDCEDAIDMLMNISLVKLAIFIRISDGICRVSFRSKGDIDVAKLASSFGGGGHFNTSGCSIKTQDIEEAKNLILKEVLKSYG